MSVNSQLSKENLNCKWIALLALSSAPRALSIQDLNFNFLATKSCYMKKGEVQPAVTYQEYTQDESLCVVRTLDKYIAQTER